MSMEPIAKSNSVFPAVFIAREDYQLSKALLWGICSKHLDVTWNSANSLSQRTIHGILFVIECVPILGQLVSLVEYVIAKILGSIIKNTKDQPEVPPKLRNKESGTGTGTKELQNEAFFVPACVPVPDSSFSFFAKT